MSEETVNGSAVGVGGVPGQEPGGTDNPEVVEAVVSEPAPMGAARNLSDGLVSAEAGIEEAVAEEPLTVPRLVAGLGKGKKRGYHKAEPEQKMSPEQRLLLLDTWMRSGLPAGDFAAMLGGAISKHTLYGWKKRFEAMGPAGLSDQPRGVKISNRLPEVTRRAILMLKQQNDSWGCQRISDMLVRSPGVPASPRAVARVLVEAGYELTEEPTNPHPDKIRSFERARPNQLWQTDLFTFLLKRQNTRVYLVAFMDDHSRFIVSYGLHASQSASMVLEVLRAGIVAYRAPEEILTDNGTQYVTWRGKSAFTKELETRGIKQIVARPRHPETLGKIERFWGTLWRDFLGTADLHDLEDARKRIGLFIDDYNFRRPHQGIEGLTPAERYFQAAPEVMKTLKARVAANALELARGGVPKEPLFLTGNWLGTPVSVHVEGERVILTQQGQERKEIELVRPPEAAPAKLPEPATPSATPTVIIPNNGAEPKLGPGQSPLDQCIQDLRAGFAKQPQAAVPEGAKQ
jgi:transposase InsO family protein